MRSLLLLTVLVTFAGCATKTNMPLFYKDLGIQDTQWGRLRVLEGLHIVKTTKPNPPLQRWRTEDPGKVTLDVLVDETGRPVDLIVVKPSKDPEFDQFMLGSIRTFLFSPWSENGKPSKVVARMTPYSVFAK